MPRFYLHVCNGTGYVEDEEGQELPDIAAARQAAIAGLRDIMASELKDGSLNPASFIEIQDEDGEYVTTISFEDAVIVREERQRHPRRS
jgi:hypothetical protein